MYTYVHTRNFEKIFVLVFFSHSIIFKKYFKTINRHYIFFLYINKKSLHIHCYIKNLKLTLKEKI